MIADETSMLQRVRISKNPAANCKWPLGAVAGAEVAGQTARHGHAIAGFILVLARQAAAVQPAL